MSKKIFKYQIMTTDYQEIAMPGKAEILTVQTQNEAPCIWALVNPDLEPERRHIEVFGTGHDVPCDEHITRIYIGTYQLNGGALIFHVFERLH